jgi:hypothetical protein
MVEMKILILFFLIFACTSTKPLENRGMSKEQRIAFINKHGGYSKEIKDAFIDKRLTFGLDKKLVIGLFGKPNSVYGDSLWWYTNNMGDGILKIEFKNGVVSSLSY